MSRAVAPVVALLALLPGRAALAELHTWVDKAGVYHVEGAEAPRKHKSAPAPAPRATEEAAPPAVASPSTNRGAVPSWQKPNLAPRKKGKGVAAAKKQPKAKWWMRRSDAPPDEI